MTQTKHKPASAMTALAPDVDSLDERSRRAWIEPMAVRPLGDGRYAVDSASGATYVVNLRTGDCSCPDSEIRGALCKHARRVAIEINQGRVPGPDQPIRCRACGREMALNVPDKAPRLCEDCRLAPGDLVFDRERDRDTPLLVISVTDRRADEVEIPDVERTVWEYGDNRKYSPSDPVVEVVYPHSVRTDRQPRRYSFPISRLVKLEDREEQSTLAASLM